MSVETLDEAVTVYCDDCGKSEDVNPNEPGGMDAALRELGWRTMYPLRGFGGVASVLHFCSDECYERGRPSK